MKSVLLIFSLFLFFININGQKSNYQFRKNIDKDSLMKVSIKNFPKNKKEELLSIYHKGNEVEKNFLLFMISMPRSSKKDLIENFENKKQEIFKLKENYLKLVPKNHIVYIEFNPANKILTIPAQIDLHIFKRKGEKTKNTNNNSVQRTDGLEVISQKWNLSPNSKELEESLQYLNWTKKDFSKIKVWLQKANCISIKNGKTTTIGFARSGMGKYSYKIFNHSLSKKEQEEYNNLCENIFYQENIVLEYGGGAIGTQCFENSN